MAIQLGTNGVSAIKVRFAPSGPAGPSGVSVTGAAVNGSNHLILTLSDASTIDAGAVIGPTGAQGVSITGATVDGSGHLVLTLSSGGTVDAGYVVGAQGAAGKSISAASVVSDHLILNFSDGSQLDCGVVRGLQGIQGVQGRPSGLAYTWSTDISATDPTSGKLKINSASYTAATALYVNETDALAVAVAAFLATWSASSSTVRGTIKVQDTAAPTNYVIYSVTGAITDQGAWVSIPVAHVDHGGVLTNGASLAVEFSRTGDKGDAGTAATIAVGTVTTLAAGASATVSNAGTPSAASLNFGIPQGPIGPTGPALGLTWSFDSATADALPSSGNLRFNAGVSSGSYSAVTNLFFNNSDSNAVGVLAWLQTLDDSTNSGSNKGTLTFRSLADQTRFAVFRVTGSITDGTGYQKVPVAHISSNGPFSGLVAVAFEAAGNKGTDGTGGDTFGSAATGLDGHLVLFDTDGHHLKDGGAPGALATKNTVNGSDWSGTDLAVADGGTGASSASAARTNLGLVPGTDVQAFDALLLAIASLTTAADKLPYFTGVDTVSQADLTSFARSLLDDANAAAARTTLGLGALATSSLVLAADLDRSALIAHGQAILELSGGNLVLSAKNGNRIIINGKVCTIPSGGVSLAPTSLTAGTNYYIYARDANDDGTVDALEASTTGYVTNTTTGVSQKNGDATRTLVGFARPNAGPVWVDTVAQRFVRSWFNRRGVITSNAYTSAPTTTSTSFTELNTAIRNEVLLWADESWSLSGSGIVSNSSAAGLTLAGVGFDGSNPTDGATGGHSSTVNYQVGATPVGRLGLGNEGYHYATIMGKVATGTGTFGSSTDSPTRFFSLQGVIS